MTPINSHSNHIVDSVSFYAALSRMDDGRDIRLSSGYEMLRQKAYEAQQALAAEDISNAANAIDDD